MPAWLCASGLCAPFGNKLSGEGNAGGEGQDEGNAGGEGQDEG